MSMLSESVSDPEEQLSSLFDRWQSLSVGLYMSIVGYSVLAGIPVISTAWSTLLGFSETEVGRVAGADLGGLSCGAIIAALLVSRVDRRAIVVAAVLFALATNLACVRFDTYVETLVLRFLSGVASGVLTGVAVATLGGRTHPARAFNYLLFSFAFVQAGEMYVLPRLSMEHIYYLFAASYLPVLLLLSWLPPRPDFAAPVPPRSGSEAASSIAAGAAQALPKGLRMPNVSVLVIWLCLFAMALTYVNIGAYWTYIELASMDAGLDSDWVSGVLIWVSFFSVAGCLVATLISDRFGLARPLLITLILHAAAVFILVNKIDAPRFLLSLYAFNFLWIFIDVYQMGSIANLDKSGRFASLIPAAQGLGQIVGPNIAASLLAAGYGYSAIFVLCAGASLCAFVVYAVAYSRIRFDLQAMDGSNQSGPQPSPYPSRRSETAGRRKFDE
ncbi:MAG: MFS transporter [Congregibacter sp.]